MLYTPAKIFSISFCQRRQKMYWSSLRNLLSLFKRWDLANSPIEFAWWRECNLPNLPSDDEVEGNLSMVCGLHDPWKTSMAPRVKITLRTLLDIFLNWFSRRSIVTPSKMATQTYNQYNIIHKRATQTSGNAGKAISFVLRWLLWVCNKGSSMIRYEADWCVMCLNSNQFVSRKNSPRPMQNIKIKGWR